MTDSVNEDDEAIPTPDYMRLLDGGHDSVRVVEIGFRSGRVQFHVDREQLEGLRDMATDALAEMEDNA